MKVYSRALAATNPYSAVKIVSVTSTALLVGVGRGDVIVVQHSKLIMEHRGIWLADVHPTLNEAAMARTIVSTYSSGSYDDHIVSSSITRS